MSYGRGWTLSSGLLLGDYPFLPAVLEGELTYRTWHVMAPIRKLVADGRVGYVPARASRLAALFERWQIGAALVRVSPPDANGYCSLGASVSYGMAALSAAAIRIAEVDPSVPRTCGHSDVHISVFDSLVESTTPIAEYVSATSDRISEQIASYVQSLLPPEPTLQVGIGAIPESLVRSLKHAGLGPVRFVGMATDDMVDLFEVGVLRREDVGDKAAVLSPDMMGTSRLLEFSHENPAVTMYPSSIAHDAGRLGMIDRFVSVNTAVEVDLHGNVNSEVINGVQISGAGGSLDYVDAAIRSTGGLRVIALPSVSRGGTVSKIVRSVSAVTIPRTMVDAVVTEYGIARLDGLTLAARAEALIAIAHPDQRAALSEAAVR